MSAARLPPSLRLLVLDDNEYDTKLAVRQLQKSGVDVSWVRVSTEEAFEEALSATVDVIIADYRVPGVDVPRAVELARRRRPDTPVVVVSGHRPEELGVELTRLGADDYVRKDQMGQLAQAIEECLDRARVRREARAMEGRPPAV